MYGGNPGSIAPWTTIFSVTGGKSIDISFLQENKREMINKYKKYFFIVKS
tara:strand:+ start:25 stop:174 length:150 start_codon:yes stop_codon:yes gene_type:complete